MSDPDSQSPLGNTIRIVIAGDGATGKTCLMYAYVKNQFLPNYDPTTFDQNHVEVTINDIKYTVILTDIAGQQEYKKLREPSYRNVDVFVLTYSSISQDSYDNVKNFWVPEIETFQRMRQKEEAEVDRPNSTKGGFRNSFKKILRGDRDTNSNTKNNANNSSNVAEKSSKSKKSKSTDLSSADPDSNDPNNVPTQMSIPTILCSTKIDLREQAGITPHKSFTDGERLKKDINAKCFVECSALTQENVKAVFDMALLAVLANRPGFKAPIEGSEDDHGNIPSAAPNDKSGKSGQSTCACSPSKCSIL